MTENEKTLTTAQYSEKTGISVSTVSRMLRQGRLRGEKRGGKWAIFKDELQASLAQPPAAGDPAAASSGVNPDIQTANGKTHDVESFARLTYLTENGVRRWFRTGRLSGSTDSGGNVQIDASNLQRPEFKHLVR